MNSKLNKAIGLFQEGNYEEALKVFNVILEKNIVNFGSGHLKTAEVQYWIAQIYEKQCKYEEAYRQFNEVYVKQARFYGTNHPETLTARESIASVLCCLGKFNEAVGIYEHIYMGRSILFGPWHSDTLKAGSNLEYVCSKLGKSVFADSEKNLQESAEALEVDSRLALKFLKEGEYEKALGFLNEVYAIKKRKKTTDQDLLETLHQIATVYYKQGKPDAAMKMLQEVNKSYTKILGEDNPETLAIYTNIAYLLAENDESEEGLGILEVVYNKQKVFLGEEHPNSLHTQVHIAETCFLLGKYETALSIYYKVYEIKKRLPSHCDDTCDTLISIGSILCKLGKYEEAFPIFREISQVTPDHPQVQEILYITASECLERKDYDNALLINSKLYEIQVKVFGSEHPTPAITRLNTAFIYFEQGRVAESLNVIEEVYQWIPNDPQSLENLNNVANLCLGMKDYDKALCIYNKLYEHQVKEFGPKHQKTLKTQLNIFRTYAQQGGVNEAIKVFGELYQLIPNDPQVMAILCKIASEYLLSKDYDNALSINSKLHEIQVQVFGPEHMGTVTTRLNMAYIHSQRGRVNESLTVYEEVCQLIPNHPQVQEYLNVMADVYLQTENYEEALCIYTKLYESQVKLLGSDHHKTLITQMNIVDVHGLQGRVTESIKVYEEVYQKKLLRLGSDHPIVLSIRNDIDKRIASQNK